MANLSQQSSRENAGTTSLGALLRAKLDNDDKYVQALTRCRRKPRGRSAGSQPRAHARTMTRSDLVEELAARFSQLTHRDAEYAVKTILDAMSERWCAATASRSAASAASRSTAARRAWAAIPRSGESVHIPEKRVPHFKPGKALREAVDAADSRGSRQAADERTGAVRSGARP